MFVFQLKPITFTLMIDEDKLRNRVRNKIKRITYQDIASEAGVRNEELSRWMKGKKATQNFLEKVRHGLTNF